MVAYEIFLLSDAELKGNLIIFNAGMNISISDFRVMFGRMELELLSAIKLK